MMFVPQPVSVVQWATCWADGPRTLAGQDSNSGLEGSFSARLD